jgi:hypothetical protein
MEKSSTIWLVLLAVVMLVVGAGIGMLYQKGTASPVSTQPAPQALIQKLNSKVIPSIVAYGQVKGISGKVITLTYGGDDVTVTMNDNAQYSALVPATKTTSANSRKASLLEIKTGSKINITLKVTPEGKFVGASSFIFPATAK